MNDTYLCKMPMENLSGDSIPVYSTWTGNNFSLSIFHHERAWHKTVSEDDLKFLSGLTQKSVEEYLLETKRALTCEGGSREFTYSFMKSEFTWKKIVDSVHDIKVKFGSLLLEEMPVSSFAENAVDFLLNRCIFLETTNASLKKENSDLKSANAALRTHVGSISRLKSEMEEALYAKFLAVLNAKKEKIYELQEFIKTHPGETAPAHGSGSNLDTVVKDSTLDKGSDLYGSETEVDTDESNDNEHSKRSTLSSQMINRMEEEEKELLPSASKSLKLDDVSSGNLLKSIAGNEDDDVEDLFVPARRKNNIKSGTFR